MANNGTPIVCDNRFEIPVALKPISRAKAIDLIERAYPVWIKSEVIAAIDNPKLDLDLGHGRKLTVCPACKGLALEYNGRE